MADFSRTLGLGVVLSLRDELTSQVLAASKAMGGLDAMSKQTALSVKQLGVGLAAGGAAILAGAGLLKGLQGSVEEGALFEKVMFDVQRTTGFTDAEIKSLGNEIVHMTAGLPVSAVELGRVATIAGQLGISSTQGAKGVLALALVSTRLARATNELSEEQAALGLGGIATLFRLDIVKRGESLGSAIVEVGRASRGTAPALLEFTERLGPSAVQFGISAENVIGLAGAVADFGISAETSAIAVGLTLGKMARDAAGFGAFFGVSAETFKKAFSKDANATLLAFVERLGQMNPQDQAIAMRNLRINSFEATRTLGAMAGNIALVTRHQELSNRASREATSLQEVFQTQMKGVIARGTILTNNLKDLGIQISKGLLPVVGLVIDALSLFVKILLRVPAPILAASGVIVGLTGVVLILGGALLAMVSVLGLLKIGLLQTAIGTTILGVAQGAGTASALRLAAAWGLAQARALVMGIATSGLSVAMGLMTGATSLASGAVTALTVAILANPIGATIALVVAAAAAFIAWTVGMEGLKEMAKLTWDVLGLVFTVATIPLRIVLSLLEMVGRAMGVISVNTEPFKNWGDALRVIVRFLDEMVSKAQQFAASLPGRVISAGGELAGAILSPGPAATVAPAPLFGGGMPMLASGAVVRGPTRAIVGDGPRPELIAPLGSSAANSAIRGAFGEQSRGGSTVMVTIPIEIDGRTIARVVREVFLDDRVSSFDAPVSLIPRTA